MTTIQDSLPKSFLGGRVGERHEIIQLLGGIMTTGESDTALGSLAMVNLVRFWILLGVIGAWISFFPPFLYQPFATFLFRVVSGYSGIVGLFKRIFQYHGIIKLLWGRLYWTRVGRFNTCMAFSRTWHWELLPNRSYFKLESGPINSFKLG